MRLVKTKGRATFWVHPIDAIAKLVSREMIVKRRHVTRQPVRMAEHVQCSRTADRLKRIALANLAILAFCANWTNVPSQFVKMAENAKWTNLEQLPALVRRGLPVPTAK